ncbi:MAG: peptide chain release factor N(5)-glutamine methyltransferase [Prevotellaceae bacterium]|jgi:release factor glutamine methyltransferase|nr:peptide chain release factor N(5)-glutamine methyltransferase [Prevotellaceae bacterium]
MLPHQQIPSYLRQELSTVYEAREAANLTKLICCELMGQPVADYYLGKDITLSAKERFRIQTILDRLKQNEPIQYIIGEARFLGRNFRVTRDVLIPRPETEELTERMIAEISPDAHILDIGTGSGCMAITLAATFPEAQVCGWDISQDALFIAETNNRLLHTSVKFRLCDVMTYIPSPDEQYDVIVSNPPYVTMSERKEMEPHVLDWEPSVALFVPDKDPLRFYRRIGVLGMMMLPCGGKLYLEINRRYGREIVEMLHLTGYSNVLLQQDISHNDRFIIAEKR